MKSTVVKSFNAVVIASFLSVILQPAFGAPPVLRWDDAAGTNVWNSSVTNWVDNLDSNVVWQAGAEALFEGSGGTIAIEEDISTVNLTFTGNGYVLSGTNLLSVEGTINASASTDNSIASELYSVAGIEKSGEGTLTLTSPSLTFYQTLSATAGTLALQDTAIPGIVSVASPADLSALSSPTNGLMGFYYNVANDSTDLLSLGALEAHLARYTPDLAALSSLVGPTFFFGDNGEYFPSPYAYGESHAEYFEVVFRGIINIPESNQYTFKINHDDGFLLAFDGEMIMNSQIATTTEGSTYLTAGKHDMVLALFQGPSLSKLKIEVKTIDESSYAILPNSWLSPYTSVNSLSGDGTINLSASGSSLNMKQVPDLSSTFTGEISSQSGTLFTKSGWGNLLITSASTTSNTIAGDVAVQGGELKLATAERIGDTSKVTVGGESVLKLAENETIGSLTGSGTVILGGNPLVYVIPFTDASDCGISTNKTYTHLLDFPADNNAATVNGVVFTAAGMNGSANGYSWSTVDPPPQKWADSGSGLEQLLNDFYYDSDNFTITLSGLTPGQSYKTCLYFRSFGSANPASPRKLNFSFSSGEAFIGSLEYNPDRITRSKLVCSYVADESGSLSMRVIAHSTGDTCHIYALSNEETPEQSIVTLEPTTTPEVVEFSGDSESGISALKTYTHKLDFPNNGSPAVVNNVTFTAAGMNGSADGYSWSTSNEPTTSWNGSPYDYSYTGVERLLWDFQYDQTDFTITLAGLHPGQSYESRLYFRSFGDPVPDSPRDVTFTFTAGAISYGSVDHDLDTMAQSMVRCSYTADSAGTVSIRVYSHNSGNACHFYGLTNEELSKPATLTLNTPAGTAPYYTGSILGSGTIVKKGGGTQGLACANRFTAPIDVQEGTLAFAPGASVEAGITVSAGATVSAPNGSVYFGGLDGAGTFNLAGVPPYPVTGQISINYFTNDVTTGISTSKVYTHLMDLGTRPTAAVINGVTFDKITTVNGSLNGYGWVNFPPTPHGGSDPSGDHGVPVGSGVYELLYDMDYGHAWPDPQTMQLTGLIPGRHYEVHMFNRTFGWGGSRTQTVTFDPDGTGPIQESVTFNPDLMEPNYIAYRYTAVSSTMEITILSANDNMTLHLYGLTNEEIDAPVEVKIAADSDFAGPVTGGGEWIKSGAGTLTLSGAGDASGAITIAAGTLGVTEAGTATTGDISVESGATLFGSGSMGGDITVASNAVIFAGSPTACGTMQIGGGLTLKQGALPRWRYESGSSDSITINGLLVFPSNGVLQVESLTAGLNPPAKATVFSSTEVIDGPNELSGWSVEGMNNSSLTYSADRKTIYFSHPSGTLIMIR